MVYILELHGKDTFLDNFLYKQLCDQPTHINPINYY